MRSSFNPALYRLISANQSLFQITQTRDSQGKPATDPREITFYQGNIFHQDSTGHTGIPVIISVIQPEFPSNRLSLQVWELSKRGIDHPALQKIFKNLTDQLKKLAVTHRVNWKMPQHLGARESSAQSRKLRENQFQPLKPHTGRISIQRLADVQLRIRHREPVISELPGARSRRVAEIWIVNGQGEKFLLPTTSLRVARALARHVNAGGTPYDRQGQALLGHNQECVNLRKFLRRARSLNNLSQPEQQLLAQVADRVAEIQHLLVRLTSERGYQQHIQNLPEPQPVSNAQLPLSDAWQTWQALPDFPEIISWVAGVYQKNTLPEIQEFQDWTTDLLEEFEVVADPKTQNNPQIKNLEKQLKSSTGTQPNKPKVTLGLDKNNKPQVSTTDSKTAAELAKKVGKQATVSITSEDIGGDAVDDLLTQTTVDTQDITPDGESEDSQSRD